MTDRAIEGSRRRRTGHGIGHRSEQRAPCRRTMVGAERATALILVPTMMIVFITLAGITIDLSALHMAKRRAVNVVSLAASDAAGMIDDTALQLDGELRIDPRRAERVVIAHVRTQELVGEVTDGPNVGFSPDGRSITVSLDLRVEHVFLGVLPSLGHEVVTVHGSASLTTDGA